MEAVPTAAPVESVPVAAPVAAPVAEPVEAAPAPVEPPAPTQEELDVKAIKAISNSFKSWPAEGRKAFMASLPQSISGTGGMLLTASLEDAHTLVKQQLQETASELATLDSAIGDTKKLIDSLSKAGEHAATTEETTEKQQGEASNGFKVAEMEYKEFKSKRESELAVYGERREQLEEAKSMFEKSRQLAESTIDTAKGVQRNLDSVMDFLVTIPGGKDKALLAAAPLAFEKDASARHDFDNATIKVVQDHVQNACKEREQAVEASAQGEALVRAELLGLWAIFDCAKDNLTIAKAAAADAKTNRKRNRSELTSAENNLASLEINQTKANASDDSYKARLEAVEAAMAAAKRLKASVPAVAAA